MNATQDVVRAIEVTKKFFPDEWKNLISHRLPTKDAAGVYIQFKNEKELEKALLSATWTYGTKSLTGEFDQIFIAPIPGLMAFEQVENLHDNVLMSVELSRVTGKATLVVRSICRNVVIQTYLITGMKEGKKVVLDFYPGEPISATKIDACNIAGEKYINKKRALELGVKWVRLV